jgi:hypothetical protein
VNRTYHLAFSAGNPSDARSGGDHVGGRLGSCKDPKWGWWVQPESDRMRTKLFHTIVLFGAALGGATACSDGGDESGEDQQAGDRAGNGGSSGHDNGGTDSGGTASGGTNSGGTAGTCVQAIATPPGGSAAGGASGGGAMIPCGGWPPTK